MANEKHLTRGTAAVVEALGDALTTLESRERELESRTNEFADSINHVHLAHNRIVAEVRGLANKDDGTALFMFPASEVVDYVRRMADAASAGYVPWRVEDKIKTELSD